MGFVALFKVADLGVGQERQFVPLLCDRLLVLDLHLMAVYLDQ